MAEKEPRTFVVTFKVETDRDGGFQRRQEIADRISDALDNMSENPGFGFYEMHVTEEQTTH